MSIKTLNLHEQKINLISWIAQLSDSSLIEKLSSIKDKNPTIPQWQMDEVRKNLTLYKEDPSIAIDFDKAMDDIEKEL